MLLSMFLSLSLARLFHRKTYVSLMAVGLIFVSCLSVGAPQYISIQESEVGLLLQSSTKSILLQNSLPLSFPFYSSLYYESRYYREAFQLHFLSFTLQELPIYGGRWTVALSLSLVSYILLLLFFSLVNIMGAIIGYRISKTTFSERALS